MGNSTRTWHNSEPQRHATLVLPDGGRDGGDAYLRTLLMHGACAVVRSDRASSWPWLIDLLKRRPCSVAVAAVANKMARTIWAVLAKGQEWRPQAWQAAAT